MVAVFKKISVITIALILIAAIAMPLSSSGALATDPAPTISSVSPERGYRGQNLDVTITGTNLNFVSIYDICFVDLWINSIISQSPTHLVVNVDIPSTSLGPRNVTVFTSGGQDALTNGFEVLATPPVPALSSASPDEGQRGATLDVTITGSNLDWVDSVFFGDGITVNDYTCTSGTQLDTNITVGSECSLGVRDVTCTTPGGTYTLDDGFEVLIGGVDPTVDPPVAAFSADETEVYIHDGAFVGFIDESTGEITSWLWDFGDGNTSTDQNPTNEYDLDGEYSVSLTVSGPGGSDTEVKDNYIDVKDKKEGICLPKSTIRGASATELSMGWGIIGLCWGTGYFMVWGITRRKR